eukprot:scaffold6355_cov119-Cylindrotheca_fusiformis.AAC.16
MEISDQDQPRFSIKGGILIMTQPPMAKFAMGRTLSFRSMIEGDTFSAIPLQLSEDEGEMVVSISEYRNLRRELFAARLSLQEMQQALFEKDELIHALQENNLDDDSYFSESESDSYSPTSEESVEDEECSCSSSSHKEIPPSEIRFSKKRPTWSYSLADSNQPDDCSSQTSVISDISDETNEDSSESSAKDPVFAARPCSDQTSITVDVVGESPLSNSIVLRCGGMKHDIGRQRNVFPMPRAKLFGLLFVLVCSFQCYFVHLLDADDAYSTNCVCAGNPT